MLSPTKHAVVSELLSVFDLSRDERTKSIVAYRVKLLLLDRTEVWNLTEASISALIESEDFKESARKLHETT